jgi:flagellar basal body-associated protein FliL
LPSASEDTAGVLVLFSVAYNGKWTRRADGGQARGGASGLVVDLLVVIVFLLVLVLFAQLGLFARSNQQQAPTNQRATPQNQPNQLQVPQDQKPKPE